MASLFEELAAEFPTPSVGDWKQSASAALKGESFEKRLLFRTLEGLSVQPLYTRADLPLGREALVPGAPPFVRGFPAADGVAGVRRGWVPTVRIEHPDARVANALLLANLMGGAAGAEIVVADPARALAAGALTAEAHAASRRGGVWLSRSAPERELATLLGGVFWSLAPIAVRAPVDSSLAARLVEACATVRSSRSGTDALQGLFVQFDVFDQATRSLDLSLLLPHVREQRPALGALARDARTLLISTEALHCAGADPAQEIAAALGAFVDLARASDAAELVRATEFRFAVASDFFTEIAKIRAFRACFCRVLDALGALPAAAHVSMSAVTSELTLARRDPHVNLLRGTEQALAAVLGGADALTVLPFDLRVNGGSAFAHRLARNVQNLLAEESFASVVADPLGGSFYVERRTDDLAAEAWRLFTRSEAAGGFFRACSLGTLRAQVDAQWEVRRKALARRKEPVLGVSEFPLPQEMAIESDAFNAKVFVASWMDRSKTASSQLEMADAAWPCRHLGEAFEKLRDTADALASSGTRPSVFAAAYGPPAAWAARLTWVRAFFAAGGITLVPGSATNSAAENAEMFKRSGAQVALLVSSDDLYDVCAKDLCVELLAAGASAVWLAGAPGAKEPAHRAAGVNEFVFAGCDAERLLRLVLEGLGSSKAVGGAQ